MNEPKICMADIKNKIYEAGLFRPDETIVLTAESCVLLEYYTGKSYSYRMIDLSTLKAKRLFARQRPLNQDGYQKAMEKMLAQVIGETADFLRPAPHDRAKSLLTSIFTDILPKHGMELRDNQLALALDMLAALTENKLALCEAEVGTGKTHAYILAVTVHNLFSERKLPSVISTSTIALQKALTEEYIPQISNILMEHRIIDTPLSFVVRKGKSHYACDSRVKTYESSIRHNARLEDRELLDLLQGLYTGACPIDLDRLPLTDYVKNRVCVERCQSNCELSAICRYRSFARNCLISPYDFHISNHNFVLADILSKKSGRKQLLPPYGVAIFDEAHKLLDAARQMYGMSFESVELERLAGSIYRAIGGHNPDKLEIINLCEEMLRQNTLLFAAMKASIKARYDKDCCAVEFHQNSILALRTLTLILRRLSVLFFTLNREKKNLYDRLVSRMEQKAEKITGLLDYAQSVYWLEQSGTALCRICTLPKALDFLLYEDIWSKEIPFILTSGTLSVSGDFTHLKRNIGLTLAEDSRLLETSKASPFNYQENALLYLPADMPFPDVKDSGYMDAVTNQLEQLIYQTHGHTLILFTSYRMMERAYGELKQRVTAFPLFLMGKGRLDAIGDFRCSGNGVLFASDSAGEGIDLAGDILSSLIVVKLPFPIPDPISEYEKSLHSSFYDYLTEVIVPEMLIKLRQWIGRGIRRETDTCVFSILDSRAGGRYRKEILDALPDMPVTDRMDDVGRFIAEKKMGAYFE